MRRPHRLLCPDYEPGRTQVTQSGPAPPSPGPAAIRRNPFAKPAPIQQKHPASTPCPQLPRQAIQMQNQGDDQMTDTLELSHWIGGEKVAGTRTGESLNPSDTRDVVARTPKG